MLDIDDQNIITSGILEQALNFMRETVNSGQAILVHWYGYTLLLAMSKTMYSVSMVSVDPRQLSQLS